MRTIAYRRYQIERLRKVRSTYWYGNVSEKQLQILVNTSKPCSCNMCGNPRRRFGEITRQEKLANLEFEQYLLED